MYFIFKSYLNKFKYMILSSQNHLHKINLYSLKITFISNKYSNIHIQVHFQIHNSLIYNAKDFSKVFFFLMAINVMPKKIQEFSELPISLNTGHQHYCK